MQSWGSISRPLPNTNQTLFLIHLFKIGFISQMIPEIDPINHDGP